MKVRRIRNKILGSVILIVIVSLTAISILAFERFSSILENQALSEDVIHLEQTSEQMDQLIDDVQKYSANMVNDELLQQFARRTEYVSVYDELHAYKEVVDHLTKFNVLRDYLASSAVIRADGKVFWSSLFSDPYFELELQKEWYRDALASGAKSGFTVPHVIQDRSAQKVISFFIRFNEDIGGVLLLNIKYEAFGGLLQGLGQSFDRYAWLKDQGSPFLWNEGMPEDLERVTFVSSEEGISVNKRGEGYYLTRSFDKTGWSIVTFTSRERFYQLVGYVVKYWAIFIALCIGLCMLLFLPIISSIMRPISQMSKAMKQVSMGNYDIRLTFRSNDELDVLRTGFETMTRDIEQQLMERVEQEKWKRRMSADLLFAQIHPHFIYNTLNTVVYLARKGNNHAVEDIVESFIGILHDAVRIGDRGLYVTVDQEKEIIDHYVRIQKYRYADKFDLVWDVDVNSEALQIPRSILQPLVENAIYHGFSEHEAKGQIVMTIAEAEDKLVMTVQDNGIGIEPGTLEAIRDGTLAATERKGGMKNIGLANIRERIAYLYGAAGKLEVESSEGVGTTVRIVLPRQPDIVDGHEKERIVFKNG
ncbi:cache domain-containing sensor histidine kinase [Cohnella boryungensis]|uniref:histidine kinase n=1 Tax=Cohnella boryungensis TaxID=768479 RepID=A0ABV8SEI7_9BACL